MKIFKPLSLALLIFTLTACADFEQRVTDTYYNLTETGIPMITGDSQGQPMSDKLLNKGGCPVVEISPDLSTLHDFLPGMVSPYALISRADVSQQSVCAYGPKSVTVDVRLTFSGMIGAAGRGQGVSDPAFSYPYFVAILAPGGKILAKQVFAVSMAYPQGADQQVAIENLRQIIPVYNQESGASHKIVVGFQLTKAQLDYNRQIIKQRLDAAAAKRLQQRQLLERSPGVKKDQPVLDIDASVAPNAPDPSALAPVDITRQKSANDSVNQ